MTKNQMIMAMREIVRALGRNIKITTQNGIKTSKVLYVPIALVCKEDKTTEVEISYNGNLYVTGWDGVEGVGDQAEAFNRKDIERLYAVMKGMGGEMDARDCWGYPLKVGQRVMWRDPETQSRQEYEVYEVHSDELVRLYNKHGECEVLPHECRILSN